MKLKFVLILVVGGWLSACSTNPCRTGGSYEQAATVGPLVNPDSFALPRPDPTYDIPEASTAAPPPAPAAPRKLAASAGAGSKTRQKADKKADKKLKRSQCLDFPPALPPVAKKS